MLQQTNLNCFGKFLQEGTPVRANPRSWRPFLIKNSLLNPPFRRQIPKCNDTPSVFRSILQHNFDLFVRMRHQLHHQLPARTAGRHDVTVRHNGKYFLDLLFSFCQHMKNRISLCTNTECRTGIYTYACVNSAGRAKNRGCNAACFYIIRDFPAMLHGGCFLIHLFPNRVKRSVLCAVWYLLFCGCPFVVFAL